MHLALLVAFLASGPSLALANDVQTERGPSPSIEELRAEAAATLSRGEFSRARAQFEAILALDPHDAGAQRDAGRAAMAAGEFAYAARVLERSHHFGGHHRDPELHYLRGEALYALGDSEQARTEHRIAELELGVAPRERAPKLWLARIHARRGEIERADRIYESMSMPEATVPDSEVALNHADGHLLIKDWDGAERILRRFIARAPDNLRARQMLAWALEAKGALDAELEVRQKLAADAPSSSAYQDYGRALERAQEYNRAKRAYQSASALAAAPDTSLVEARARMQDRTSPEASAGIMARTDSAASGQHLQAGIAVPFGTRHLASLLAWHDILHQRFPVASGSASAVTGSLVLGTRFGGSLALSGQMRGIADVPTSNSTPLQAKQGLGFGGAAQVQTPVTRHVLLDVRGDFRTQWTDAPVAMLQGGRVTGITGHAFVFPVPTSKRVVIDSGAQARRLTLAPRDATAAAPEASQLLAWTGVDFILWHDPTQVLKGEILDESLLRGSGLAESVTLNLRHYELFGRYGDDFTSRIALLDRSSIENGTLVVRNVFLDGRFAFEAHVGLGWEHHRSQMLSQGGLSLLAMPTPKGRVVASYDMAQEVTTGFAGRRHIGWLSYHADL